MERKGRLEDSLQYLDRYRNEGTRTYSQYAGYSEALPKYRPNSTSPHFELPVYEVPRDQMLCYLSDPPFNLKKQYLTGENVLFCMHPQVLENCASEPYVRQTLSIGTFAGKILVSPSSSTRTLYVRESTHPHALKVHFPFRISRYGRKMRSEVIEQAIDTSKDLERGIGQLDVDFAFLREVIGIAHRNLSPHSERVENWGYLVRDMTPFPSVDSSQRLIPGFALYGKDFYDLDKPPLLVELIGDRDPLSFTLEKIMLPIQRHWITCFLHFGYLLEPHGQNVLLEVSDDGDIKRIVHRDLSLGIDMRRRRALGFMERSLNQYNRMESGEFLSITYDKFMGAHFFDRIVAVCRKRYANLERADFTEPCRAEFSRLFADHGAYFPETVHYFSEKRDEFDKPLFVDTGAAPEWRP